MNAKKLAIVSVAFAGLLAAASVDARGRDDVQFSVTIGSPVWSVQPVPVYGPALVARSYDRYHERSYRSPTRWDRDGDGIPNRYDRYDNLRHGRDGRGGSRW